MSDQKEKGMFEGLIDSVIGTSQFLWDFLGDPPKQAAKAPEPKPELPEPSILDMFPREPGRIPPEVVDTEGESEDA